MMTPAFFGESLYIDILAIFFLKTPSFSSLHLFFLDFFLFLLFIYSYIFLPPQDLVCLVDLVR